MIHIDKAQSLETSQLLPRHKIILGIMGYIVLGELLKDAFIFPVVEPYLQSIFSPIVTELLSEFTEYLLLSALLVTITLCFIVEPVNAFSNTMIRKNYEAQALNDRLANEKNVLDMMFRHHAAVMLLVDPADGGKILDANNAALIFYGYSHEEMTKMTVSNINMSCQGEVMGAMNEAYAGSQNVFIFPHRLKSGVVRDVEVHSSKISVQGKRLLFSIVRDITDKLRYQKKLMESEEKFRIVFENSGDANYISTLDGQIVEANTAFLQLFRYEPGDLSGLSTQDLYFDHSDRAKFVEEIHRNGFVKNFEEKLRTKNAQPLDCQVTATVRRLPDKTTIGYHGSIQDITELKLRQAEKEELIIELQDALAKVKTLSGLLPICSHCKKIRDDNGYWVQIEKYISDHCNADFSHGICQACVEKYYSDYCDVTD